jgi:hypothetical protein
MRTINFTRYASPVSDFDAEATIAAHMRTLEIDEDAVVETCNLLIWQMLRAELINNPLKFEIVWQFEGVRVDMDVHLRSGQFWQHPVTNLEEDALFKLVEPTTLRSNGEYS